MSAGGVSAAGRSRAIALSCWAWVPQIRRLRRRIGKDCAWEHPRAPAARWLWDERATGAVLEFMGGTRVGCRTPTRAASGRERTRDQEGKRVGRAYPRLYFP